MKITRQHYVSNSHRKRDITTEKNPTYITYPLPPTNFPYQQKYLTGPHQFPMSDHKFTPIATYNTTVIPTTNTVQEVNYSSFRGIGEYGTSLYNQYSFYV